MNNDLFNSGRTFIIAEISANHNHDIKKALKLIEAAKESGADAVKFQAYTPETMTIDVNKQHFIIEHSEWGGQTLYELYRKAYTPWEWFPELKKAAEECEIIFFATAFDNSSVDMLEDIGVPIHKIASFELVDIPLIEYVSSKGKPLIISTGMGSKEEINDAVRCAKENGAQSVTLLKCISSYPADPNVMNLSSITDLKKTHSVNVGLSDHSLDPMVPVVGVALGASVIERHFTISRNDKTPDSFFSTEPQEFKELVEKVRKTEKIMGSAVYGVSEAEKNSLVFRRSLFVIKDVKAGELFSKDNLRSIRPAGGIPPKHLNDIIGKKASKSIERGTPLSWDLIE